MGQLSHYSAQQSGLLYVGDAIVEVNGQLLDGKTHDEVVQLLRDAGDEVSLSVRHYTQIAPYLKFVRKDSCCEIPGLLNAYRAHYL